MDKLQDKNSILNCFETDFNKNNALTYLNNHIVTTANLIKEHIVDFIKDIAINEFNINYWNEWLEEQEYNILQEEPTGY